MTLKEWQDSILNYKSLFKYKNNIYIKLLTNKIRIISKIEGDFLIHGSYLSNNKCLVTILRFDEPSGWDPLKISIDNDEIIDLNNSKISNYTYKIETKLFCLIKI